MQSDNIINNYISTIITIFLDVTKNYENALQTIKRTEAELNDINHEIEFSSPKDLYKGYLTYRSIHDLRTERRIAKEQVELLKDFYDFIKSQQGGMFKSALQKIQSNSMKIKNTQDNRTYTPKQREDLTINGKTTDNRSFEQMLQDFKNSKQPVVNGRMKK